MHILFDIGKTKMRVAGWRGEEAVGEVFSGGTPKGADDMAAAFGELARRAAGGEKIKGAVGGIGVPLDAEKRSSAGVRWVGKPLRDMLSRAIGAPVLLENDAAMAVVGEAVHGAGAGKRIVAYMTVSTAVGGARAVEGELDEASFGFEPGHQIIDPDNTLCPDCPGNTLIDYVSGTGVEERFGKKPYKIDDPHLWEEELPRFLAYGLWNAALHWSPDTIILGGSMILGNPAISLEKTAEHFAELAQSMPVHPAIVPAALGDESGLYGALEYARRGKV